MRRLQANLAYLAAIADRAHKPASHIPPAPAIMAPPEAFPTLAELYKKLAALFPGVSTAPRPFSTQPKSAGIDHPGASGPSEATSATTSPGQGMANSKESTEAENRYQKWLEEMGGPPKPGQVQQPGS